MQNVQNFTIVIPNKDHTKALLRKTIEVPVFWDEEFQEWSFAQQAYNLIDLTREQLYAESLWIIE